MDNNRLTSYLPTFLELPSNVKTKLKTYSKQHCMLPVMCSEVLHSCPERLWVPHLWRCQGQVGWGPGQPELVGGSPDLSRMLELVSFMVSSNPNHSMMAEEENWKS